MDEIEDNDSKVITMDDFIQQIKEEQLMDPKSGLKDRLNKFRHHMYDFRFDMLKFTVMGDTYISFFKISEEEESTYLEGGFEIKADILDELDELEEPDEILNRALHMCNLLIYTNVTTKDKFYGYVANRLMYVLSGEQGFLTDIGLSLYNIPPISKKNREIVVPNKPIDGMYQ